MGSASADPIRPATLTIYHEQPRLALAPGARSKLDAGQGARVLKEAGWTGGDFFKDAARLERWMEFSFDGSEDHIDRREFELTGEGTARGLLRSRKLRSCLDWALLKAALIRSAGYPALIVEAVDVRWMKEVRNGRAAKGLFGHVLVEVYVGGRWALLDSTSSKYIPDYDPANPIIPESDGDGYLCAAAKGRDPVDYGLGTVWKRMSYLRRFAKSVDPDRFRAPGYKFVDLPGSGESLPNLSEAALARPDPSHPGFFGATVQIRARDLDIHVEKSGGRYLALLYPYGRVFQGRPAKTLSFGSRAALKRYLWSLLP
ncbi:MAG: transglutaminase domain-containing protein [Elusimicrobia bacterium]|nr:transglutaminase domain-containing protein [Elusimicrobiota bacterium]MDE2236869.1 transglutaminase domain-containing protein [Elusimicrobiota bacterium]